MSNTVTETLTVNCIGKLSEKSVQRSKTANLVDCRVKNVLLMQDVESGSAKGLSVGGKTIFNGEDAPKYRIFACSKNYLGSYYTENFNYLCQGSDVKALQDVRVDRDYFSFDAIINPNNFDGNFYKVKNIQKIKDAELVKKIRTISLSNESDDSTEEKQTKGGM